MATIDAPVVNDSITNKQATQNNSLYHTCRYVLQAVSTIHLLQPYLAMSDSMNATTPMSKLWHFCRQGTSLCILFNTLRPDVPIPYQPPTSSSSTVQKPKPKHDVYQFMVACRDQLLIPPELLFTPKDVFEDDTNGFVKVVNILKRVVDQLESQGIITAPSLNQGSDPTIPKSNRDKIVMELLETERKYVQDLEILQNYMEAARSQGILPPDTLHQLFGNLDSLADQQRKFLVVVEDQALCAPEDQRFGFLFIDNEQAFSVYEPFCANFQTAQTLVNRESHVLEKLSHLLSSTFELPSFLIKPVQRICKYPLLMKELVKTTPTHWPFYNETRHGLEAIQRVAAKVNETSRLQENLATLQLLKEQVDDFPLTEIDDFGALLLHDKFMLYRGDPGRELIVYLFEKCLFVCREEKDKDGSGNSNKKSQKKSKKSIGGSNMADNSSVNAPCLSPVRLVVRGKILISRVVQVTDASQDGTCFLQIFWSERYTQPGQNFHLDSFTLKCRHQEHLQQWESSLNDLIKQSKKNRHLHHAMDATTSTMIDSPQLLSPSMTTSHSLSRLDSNTSDSYYTNKENDDHRLGNHYNMAQQSHPPLLRQHSHNAAYDMTLQQFPHSVRISPSHYSASPTACSSPGRDAKHDYDPLQFIPTTEFFTQQLLSEQHTDDQHDDYLDDDYGTYSSDIQTPQTPQNCTYISQQYHHTAMEKQLPAIMPSNSDSIHLRLRSQSSPNIHPPQSSHSEDPLPPLPDPYHRHNHHLSQPQQHSGIVKFGKRKSNEDQDLTKHLPPLVTSTRTASLDNNNNNTSVHPHHQQYYQSVQQPSIGSKSSTTTATTTRIKVNHMGNIYVLMAPSTIDYNDLVDRIERKMKCDNSITNVYALIVSGLKYRDEVGDYTRLSCNDDLQMALEARDTKNALNLYII